MLLPRKISVIGVGISATSYAEAAAVCRKLIDKARSGASKRASYICVTSAHGIISARFDPEFRAILNRADMATPDGMPLVWALRSFGVCGQQRVYGPELMLALLAQAASMGHRVFLYGGRADCLAALEQRLKHKYPGLQIAGAYSPPFRPLTPEEDRDLVAKIRQSAADLLFVGLSTPKQEYWMAQHVATLPGVVLIGVGAAFDFHAGRVRQAPAWMQGAGLEWFFRLMMEPARLWKRYLLITPLFLPLWALQKMRILRLDLPSAHEGSA